MKGINIRVQNGKKGVSKGQKNLRETPFFTTLESLFSLTKTGFPIGDKTK
jgi:hypothetical protein